MTMGPLNAPASGNITLQQLALQALRQAYGGRAQFNQLGPGGQQQGFNRANAAENIFNLRQAMGQFGGVGIDPITGAGTLGGTPWNQVASNQLGLGGMNGAINYGNGRDFRSFMQAVAGNGGGGLRSSNAQTVLNVQDALGIGSSGSAAQDYGGIVSQFMQPRVNSLPTALRGMANNQVQGVFDDVTLGASGTFGGGNPYTASQFINDMFSQGGFF